MNKLLLLINIIIIETQLKAFLEMFGFIFLFFTARIEPVHMAGHRKVKKKKKKK